MAKKLNSSSESSIQRRIKEGRGDGRGCFYKPWITVRDCASRGRSHRVFGHKSQRGHHLLSDLELAVFLLLEWHPDTEEIREQFPLCREDTIAISQSASIKHPNMYGVQQVMSSDFLVNTRDISSPKFAIQAKYVDDLKKPRTIEKLEIERRYWALKSVPWTIITERDIPDAVFANINWLYPLQGDGSDHVDYMEKIEFYSFHFKQMEGCSIVEIAKKLDKSYELELGQSLLEIRTLLARRFFLFDISVPFRQITGNELRLGEVAKMQEVLHVSNQ